MNYLWFILPVLGGVLIGCEIIRRSRIDLSRLAPGNPQRPGEDSKSPAAPLSPDEFRTVHFYTAPAAKTQSENGKH